MSVWRNKQKRKEEIFSALHEGDTLLVFDTETTGVKDGCKVIQASMVKYLIEPGFHLKQVDFLDRYINPQMPLPDKIVEITGITDRILAYAPPEKEIAAQIFSYMEDAHVWAAYNAPFDIRMLSGMAARTRCMMDAMPCLDVLEMARDWFCGELDNFKLGTVFTELFPDESPKFHSAIEDSMATGKVMEVLLAKYLNFEEEPKIPAHLKKAGIFINPNKKSQQRIRLTLDKGEPGDIYYDIIGRYWSHKKTKAAEKLFDSLDMADLERQMLSRYGFRFGYSSIDEIARGWLQYKKQAS